MQGSVTLYFNTGFNGIDIPKSAAVLSSATQKTYNNVYFIRQDVDNPIIRIQDTYENIEDVDYCKIVTNNKTCYYYVGKPETLAQGVQALPLDLDALLTMGGAANLSYVSGWQERGHIAKTDDTLFGNVAAEDWRPSQPLVNADMTTLKMTSSVQDDLEVVISNIDIGTLGNSLDTQEVIEGVTSADPNTAVMYFPSIKAPTTATAFFMYDYLNNQNMSFTIPNTAAYNAENTTVKQGLQKLYSCGQLQLQASYKIPKEYVESFVAASDGRYTNITGGHAETPLNDIPFEYGMGGYTPKNKKVYATYRQISLCAIGSGDMIVKAPEDLYDGHSTAPTVRLWADMASTGKPYARWAYIKGSTVPFADCVKGLQWANSQLVMEGASGSMWNSINNAFANQSAERAASQNTYNLSTALQGGSLTAKGMTIQAQQAQIGALASLPGILMGGDQEAIAGIRQGTNLIASAAQMDVNLDKLKLQMDQAKASANFTEQAINQQINENAIGLIKNNNVVAPTVNFTPEQNLGLYGYNYFVAFQTIKSLDDLKSEDQYYQRYGYNGLHRPLTAQCFNERQYYNYVQAFDVNIKSSTPFGLRIRQKAISQLNKGVRVWSVLPDASYYELN